MQTENDTALAEFPARLARVTKEGLMVLFIGVSLFLLLALMGYDARDPGWSHLAYQPNVSNFTGVVGAWVADLFFATLGYAAYLVPFVVAIASFGLLKNRQMSLSDSIPFFILRTMGVLVVLAAFSGLAATHLGTAVQTFPFSAGGLVGEVISDYSVGYLHYVGASVVLTFLALFGLTLYIRQSWLSLLERLGLQTEKLTTQLFDTSSKAIVGRKAKSAVEVPEHDDFYERGEPALGELTPEAGAEQPTQAVAAPVSAPDPLLSQEALLAARIGENSHTKTEKVEQAHSPTSDYIRRPVENNVPSSPNVPNSPVAPSVEEAPVLRPEPVEQKTLSSEKSQTLTSNAAQSVEDTQKQQEQEVNQAFKGAAPDSVNTQSRVVDKEKSNTLDSASHNSVVVTDKVDEALPVSAVTSAATEPAPEKKGVKIVPLAEAHKPMKDRDLGLDGKQVPAVTKEKVQLPSLDLLDPPSLNSSAGYSSQELEDMSRLLEAKLKDFNVIAEVVEVNPGPVITRFEIQPAPGVKASKITNLAQDLARSMAVSSVRVVEVIPGKSVVGIEIPNEERQTVSLSEVLNSKPYLEAASKLTLGLGNDIAGNPVVANLAKMPHLLVAGTTGSGKSVGVNAMLISLLFRATPEEVRLIMVDPKMLELSIYDGIPHLLTPVITDMKDAAAGLRWCVGEMEERYRLMAKLGVRNIDGYNDKVAKAAAEGEPIKDPFWKPEDYGLEPGSTPPDLQKLPYIVVVIDEFADMMMIVGKKVEELIARIAQKARAAGIHLILATQRPSVDVITGLIKANVPTRIAFQVATKIDSRTILDQSGAEHLLGWGDMLYMPAGRSMPNRVHGAFVSDDEVHRVVEAWKALGTPVFIDAITNAGDDTSVITGSGSVFDDEQDELYDQALAFVTETRKASISGVQRKFKIGYNRSARLIEAMESAGVVSSPGSNGQREVLAPPPVKD